MKLTKCKAISIALLISFIWLAWPMVARRVTSTTKTTAQSADALQPWQSTGQLGDTYGGLNTLFTGLACAAVFFTFLQQQKQIKDATDELEKQANARTETSSLLRTQARAMVITAKFEAFKTRIDIYEQQIDRAYDRGQHDTAKRMEIEMHSQIVEIDKLLKEAYQESLPPPPPTV